MEEKELMSRKVLSNVKVLDSVPNPHPDEPYQIELTFNEFTSNCRKTRLPDFATVIVQYIPNDLLVETKSFNDYMVSFRDSQMFMEDITNTICKELTAFLKPKRLLVNCKFTPRFNTSLNITVQIPSRRIHE